MNELDLMRHMTESQRLLFQTEMLKRRKSTGVAAVLCFLVFGLHRFYLGQIGLGLLYALTFGLFFIGSLIDLLRIRTIVERVNLVTAQEVAAHLLVLDAPGSGPSNSPAASRTRSTLIIFALLIGAIIIVGWMATKR
jgi:TM2 domain-containing membrane protein YozV